MITLERITQISKAPINLIYDKAGNVIGNSQELALALLKMHDSVDKYWGDNQKAKEKLCNAIGME